MKWVFISQKTTFIVVIAVKTSNLIKHEPSGLCSGDVMFPVRYEPGSLTQKTTSSKLNYVYNCIAQGAPAEVPSSLNFPID
jgi:hypothetical protein